MGSHLVIYQLLTLLTGILCATLAVLLWRRHNSLGSQMFVGFFSSAAFWCGCAFLIGQFWGTPLANVFYRVLFVAVSMAIYFFFFSALWYNDREQYITRSTLGALLLHPLLVSAVNSIPTTKTAFVQFGPPNSTSYTGYTIQFGPGFIIHTVYGYLLIVVSLALFLGFAYRSGSLYRKQSLAVAIAILSPTVANVTFIFNLTSLDFTPIGFALTAIALWWAVEEQQFGKIAPVAKATVVSEIDDAVIILNADNRLVDYNPAAAELFGIQDGRGQPAADVLSPITDTVTEYADVMDTNEEITVTKEGTERHFQLTISSLGNSGSTRQGRAVVLRNITEIRQREQELDLMRQVQSRVLRHNIRNDLQTVKMYNEMLADTLEGQQETMAEESVKTTNDLLSISDKARAVAQLVDKDQTPKSLDLVSIVNQVVDTYRREFPDVDFHCECPDECSATAIPAVEIAFENLIENAAEHTDTDSPRVEITVAEEHGAPTVTVSDNGPGIPNHELSVLEAGEETPLQHGSGIGLWVVHWVLDNSTAEIEYETGAAGTEITIRLSK